MTELKKQYKEIFDVIANELVDSCNLKSKVKTNKSKQSTDVSEGPLKSPNKIYVEFEYNFFIKSGWFSKISKVILIFRMTEAELETKEIGSGQNLIELKYCSEELIDVIKKTVSENIQKYPSFFKKTQVF